MKPQSSLMDENLRIWWFNLFWLDAAQARRPPHIFLCFEIWSVILCQSPHKNTAVKIFGHSICPESGLFGYWGVVIFGRIGIPSEAGLVEGWRLQLGLWWRFGWSCFENEEVIKKGHTFSCDSQFSRSKHNFLTWCYCWNTEVYAAMHFMFSSPFYKTTRSFLAARLIGQNDVISAWHEGLFWLLCFHSSPGCIPASSSNHSAPSVTTAVCLFLVTKMVVPCATTNPCSQSSHHVDH